MTDHNARQAGLTDDFRGNTPALIRSIEALISLSDEGALVPHGIGGHARGLLSAAAVRLAAHSADARNGEGMAQGWKLVPEIATREMQDAFNAAPFNRNPRKDFDDAYAAMLLAAPAAPAPHANCPAPGDETESAEREHLGCAHCETGIYAAPAPAAQADYRLFCRVEDVFDNDSILTQLGVKRGDHLYSRQQSATPPDCTCPSGNGSLRHPCPVHAVEPNADRAMLKSISQDLESSVWECGRCGNEEPCKNLDVAYMLRNYLNTTPADAASEADKRAIPMTGDEIRAICRDARAHCAPSDAVQGSDYVLATLRYLNQRERQQGEVRA